VRKSPRLKLTMYASTGSHGLPWVPMDDESCGGRVAIFETYRRALADSFGPDFVHRVTLLIERAPAPPEKP
jgi:hypothetical protein